MRTERPDRKQADHAPRHDGERGGARSKERETAFRGIPIAPGVANGADVTVAAAVAAEDAGAAAPEDGGGSDRP